MISNFNVEGPKGGDMSGTLSEGDASYQPEKMERQICSQLSGLPPDIITQGQLGYNNVEARSLELSRLCVPLEPAPRLTNDMFRTQGEYAQQHE